MDGGGIRPLRLLLDLEGAPVVEAREDVGVGGDEVLRGHGGIPVRVVRVVRGGGCAGDGQRAALARFS